MIPKIFDTESETFFEKAKQTDFDDALVNFVAETGVSFNVLGSESFKELIGVANRHLHVKKP